ncbi:hypothetical protein L0664_13880 [Octadecabacter sp. G9-8]|uniref:Uncharacterized protein n=1 Tax=Octadecabacter dasysiphoniae TaxID=2909341 RepID=A0ABS9D189_9RHOB|nr:hypothetical protein [Octadecabacter dasysiphoniae]MCF2872161.1 hypothetical protein [Octadecabacter dasysiphoniae]
MDGIGDIFAGIFELFVRLLYGIIRLIIRTIGLILSQTWLVNHFEAMRNFGAWLSISMGAYLLFGIIRAMVPAFYTPALTPIFQWQIVVGAMVLLLVGIAMRELDKANYVPDNTRHAFEPDRPVTPKDTGPIQTTPTIHSSRIVAGLVLLVLVVGIISAFSSERHEATLAEKLCAQADARISDGVEQTVRDGAGFLDRVLGTQTADRIPCGDD